MAVQTSKVTTASNGTLQLDPNGSGAVQLTKLAGSGNQPVGVDNNGNTQKFLPSTTAARGTAAGSDIIMVQAAGATAVTQTTVTALVTAGGGGGSGGIPLTALSVSTEATGTATGALSYNNTSGVFTFTPVKADAPANYGPTPPGSPSAGDLWFDTNAGLLNVWTGSEWVSAFPCCEPKRFLSSDSRFEVKTVTLGQVLVLDATIIDRPISVFIRSYEWYKGNQKIEGMTQSKVETQSVGSDHLGLYTCRIELESDEGTQRLTKSFFVTEALTPFTSSTAIGGAGPVVSLVFDKNGTGYTDVGPVTLPVRLDGTDGENMTIETTSDGDAVTSVALVDAGTGYTDGDTVRINGGNDDATVLVGVTSSLTVANAGSGYLDDNDVIYETLDGNGVAGPNVRAEKVVTASLAVTTAGSGYTTSGSFATITENNATGPYLQITTDGNAVLTAALIDGDPYNMQLLDGTVLTVQSGNYDATITVSNHLIAITNPTIVENTLDNGMTAGTVYTVQGGNVDATVTLGTVTTTVEMTTGGDGYGNTSPVTVDATGGSGQNCTVEITIVDEKVVNATLDGAGTGYFANEVLTLDGGSTPATITIKV